MFLLIGAAVVFACVLGGYVAGGGHLSVLWQPFEAVIIVGAAIVRKDKFDALTEKQQKVLVETGARAHAALNKIIHRDDEKAYQTVLKRGLTAVDTSEHEAEWTEVARQVRDADQPRSHRSLVSPEVEPVVHPALKGF